MSQSQESRVSPVLPMPVTTFFAAMDEDQDDTEIPCSQKPSITSVLYQTKSLNNTDAGFLRHEGKDDHVSEPSIRERGGYIGSQDGAFDLTQWTSSVVS